VWSCTSSNFDLETRWRGEYLVNSQASLTPRREPPVSIVFEATWGPEPVTLAWNWTPAVHPVAHLYSDWYIMPFYKKLGLSRCMKMMNKPERNKSAEKWSLMMRVAIKKLNSVALVCEHTIPTSDRRLSTKLVPTFADRVCRVVSATSPNGSILDFLDPSRYFFFQVTPQL
jgi:hypothetical protein